MKKYFLYLILILSACDTQEKAEDPSIYIASKETELKKLVEKFPDSLIVRESLIQHYREAGNYDKAITETGNAIKKNNNNARLYNIQGILYFENGDTLTAITSFEKAIQFNPAAEYLVSLGLLYAQTKNSKAIILADVLAEEYKVKSEKDAFFIKGLYYNYTNEKEKAVTFFDKALVLNYTFMDAYREKAIALYDLEKYNEALTVLNKAVTLQNNFDEGYYYKGLVLEKLNRKDEAVESYNRALLYDPEYKEAKDAIKRLNSN
ncbi:MAG: tetratricopeptide repeat protein [Ferruginibacter sp.]